ncbi:MAG: reprolysin-like metallopeptidase [Saprospiraceae bacterium]
MARQQVREIIPNKYQTYTLDHSLFKEKLDEVDHKSDSPDGVEKTISLPMPDGTSQDFNVWEASVMEQPLADKYPDIKSYKGYSTQNSRNTVRFSVGPHGFHAAINTADGMIYIDPYALHNNDLYQVYYTYDHHDPLTLDGIKCGTVMEEIHRNDDSSLGTRSSVEKIELRKYRLGLGCTGEWGAVRGTKEKALADMVTFVERANVVFEAELAISVVLVARNDELIFLDGTSDPYNDSNKGLSLVGQNTNILNGRIGFGSYDVGHLLSICNDVGGVAAGNICTQSKGAGVTCHNSATISTGIVLVFNHEVGHQMTASHTFNRCGDSDQLALGTAYEPGSGSTIMAYPGACGSDNLGAPRDDYYHVASLDQMLSFTNSASAAAYLCAEKIDIGNFKAVISLPYNNGFSIPKSTPFFLTGTATDENGDVLTYNWDQFDNQTSSVLGAPVGNAPIFRSLKPTTNPTRFFPNVSRILGGQFTDKTELLPTYGRDLTFRFVVRDNFPKGSAAVWEEMKFKVADEAGPFRLTFPTNGNSLIVGKELEVTWDVAKTDLAPVNCQFVDIYMDTKGTLEFDTPNLILLAKSTKNDGSESVIVPNKVTNFGRVVVKASDNIFFTTGLFNSNIEAPTSPAFIMEVAEPNKKICLPIGVVFDINTTGFAGLDKNIKFDILSGLPEGAIATFEKTEVMPGQTNKLNLNLDKVTGTKTYEIMVRSMVDGIDTIIRPLRLEITGTDLDAVTLTNPENGLNGVGPTQKYQWEKRVDATEYQMEVATNPAFATSDIIITQKTNVNNFDSNVFLEKATIYFWRTRASNACRDGAWSEISAFNTEALNCTTTKSGELIINISASGTPTIESELNVVNDAIVSDVNIKNLRGDHQWSGDLVTYLVAPSGKEALLWSRKCGSSKGFNLGLDEQSNEFFQCPINTGRIYRTESSLTALNGENMKGIWKLRIEDKQTGNGGRLQNFDLELCANVVLNPPVLIKNEVLKIHPKNTKSIANLLLLCEDPNNTAGELTYTLVKAPSYGMVTINNAPLHAGSKFTQEQINQNKLNYHHTSEGEKDDHFRFIVSDGQGGWVSITEFKIDVDASIPSSNEDLIIQQKILLYPNPAGDLVNIRIPDEISNHYTVNLLDLTGNLIYTSTSLGNNVAMDVSGIASGVYVVQIATSGNSYYKKMIKN